MKKYDTDDWNWKLSNWDAMDIAIDGDLEGWDLVDGKPHMVRVDKIWEEGSDLQNDMLHWADNNGTGYFYQYSFGTEGGTPIIRTGDKFNITMAFQKQEDAMAFKLRWV